MGAPRAFNIETAAKDFAGPGRTVTCPVRTPREVEADGPFARRQMRIEVNGWTLSAVWGRGTYCTAGREGWPDSAPDAPPVESPDTEVAAWKGDGEMIELHGDTVEGWVSPEGVLAAVAAAERDDEDGIRAALVRTEVEMPRPETGAEWCEFYGVEIRKGGNLSRDLAGQDVAILFKAVGEGYRATNDFAYEPGTAPEAPDWDGGSRECGGGLHFSPHPKMAKEFNREPAHFVACPVLVSEIVVHPDGTYPQKVKAPRVAAPCWEVGEDGNRIDGEDS